MTVLAEHLIERIHRTGPLSVEDYMRLCLFHPEHGYYRTRLPIGAAGDFVTAPEVSQMFGELVGLWAAALWAMLGRPSPVRLVELGPGRGTLMGDALRAVAKVAPDFRAAVDVHLVEVNDVLRRQQADALSSAVPHWHDDIASVPAGPAIVIANEFFDAFPVRQIVRTGSGWRERVVDAVDGRFVFAAGGPMEPPAASPAAVPDGAILEWSPDRDAYARRLALRIAEQGGGALIIDYGPFGAVGGDTLQAVRAQKKADPLAEPGLADLTAHVDFSALAAAANAAGAAAYGPVPQGAWLRRLGIAARAATLLRAASAAQARDIEAAMRRLIEPDEMGTLFKVLAIAPHGLPAPPAFDA
jgi:SAM-dependent MidA family methyltransferase